MQNQIAMSETYMRVVGEGDKHEVPCRSRASACVLSYPTTCWKHTAVSWIPFFYLPRFRLSHLSSPSPSMAATSGGSWVCVECGKVCKSRGGLRRHALAHKRHIRVGEPHGNFDRVYHPTFDCMFYFLLVATSSNFIKRNCVTRTKSFFHLERLQRPHNQRLTTIGPPLSHVPGSNLLSYSTLQYRSQTTPLISFSTFGPPHWYLLTTPHQYLITKNFTRPSTQSNLAKCLGSHTLFSIMASDQTTDLHPSG